MATMAMTPVDDATAQELSERLADVFRTGKASDVLTEDLFLDGHPPLWRFQLQGRDAFAAWLGGYAPAGAETTVVRTIPTATGFVTDPAQIAEAMKFVEPVTPRDDEPIVRKPRISAFYGTELQSLLTARDIDTLVLTGVATTYVARSPSSACRPASLRM